MMTPIPSFTSQADYLRRRGDLPTWRPVVHAVLQGLGLPCAPLVAGHNPTHPTFLSGERVVKLMGRAPFAERAWLGETRALARLAQDPALCVPRLLAAGTAGPGWRFLIMSRVPGRPLDTASPALAEQIGAQLARVQALPTAGLPTPSAWTPAPWSSALAGGCLPVHLRAQVPTFVERYTDHAVPPVLLHGDLVDSHVFITPDGALAALIDWGDALVADPQLEWSKLFFHTFGGDSRLLTRCIEAAGHAVGVSAPQRLLAASLRRQALGRVQHYGFDIFHHLPAWFGAELDRMTRLEQLADALWARTP